MDHSASDENQRAAVEIIKDENGISQVLLRSLRGASARVSLHGGQVRSWKTKRGEELLFTSTKAILKPPAAVRGGIPICFPQFGKHGSLDKHGFARNRIRVIDENPPSLPSTDSNISEVRIEGLGTLDYFDNLCNRECFTEQGDALTFESEFFRCSCTIRSREKVNPHDPKGRASRYWQPNFPEFVVSAVWNPWEKKSRAILDFGDEEYKKMFCVDAAAIEKPITLKPGEEWTGKVELSVVASVQ